MTTTSPRRPGGAEAMREAAAKVADKEARRYTEIIADEIALGHQPSPELEFRLESVEWIAARIRALPLPAGDTLSTGGWNYDMEKAPKGTPVDLWRNGERLTGFTLDEHGRWTREEGYPSTTRVLLKAPTYWRLLPEPPPGE